MSYMTTDDDACHHDLRDSYMHDLDVPIDRR